MILRTYSQIYKGMILIRRNFFRFFDITIWPLVLLLSITLFVNFVNGDLSLIGMVLLGVLGWRMVYHIQIEIAQTYMDEFWTNSINHFLVSPLRFSEYVISSIIIGLIKFIFVGVLYFIVGWLFFGYVPTEIWTIILGLTFLALFGVALGFLTLSIIIIYHENSFAFSYAIPDIIILLSGVYYPITIFPEALQAVVEYIPSVYAFETLRSTVGLGTINLPWMFATTIGWLLFCFLLLSLSYRYARKHGKLAKMG